MLEDLEQHYRQSAAALVAAEGREALAAWHRDTLGKKGSIYLLTRNLGALSAEERPAFGRRLNEIKAQLEAGYDQRLAEAEAAALDAQMAAGALDVTLPGRRPAHGRLHITTRTLRDIYRIFGDMGFQVYRSPDVETDEMNFELLNFRPTTRRERCRTASIRPHRASSCAPTPAPARSAPCASTTPTPSASSCRACATATSR